MYNIDDLSKPCQNKDYVTGINKLLGKILKDKTILRKSFPKSITFFSQKYYIFYIIPLIANLINVNNLKLFLTKYLDAVDVRHQGV
jgi:hypothetical protein